MGIGFNLKFLYKQTVSNRGKRAFALYSLLHGGCLGMGSIMKTLVLAMIMAIASHCAYAEDLQVVSMRCYESGRNMIAYGKVQNVSDKYLEKVIAQAEFRNRSGDLIRTSYSYIDYDPLPPGGISYYKVKVIDSSSIKSCNMSFRTMFYREYEQREAYFKS